MITFQLKSDLFTKKMVHTQNKNDIKYLPMYEYNTYASIDKAEECTLSDLYWLIYFVILSRSSSNCHLDEAKSSIANTNGSDDFPGFCRSVDRAASIRSGLR